MNNEQGDPKRLEELSPDEIKAALGLDCLDRTTPPKFLLELCGACLICENPITKQLSASDVDPKVAHKDSLVIPKDQVEKNILRFLPGEEVPAKGIDINIYDSDGKNYLLCLKRNGDRYVITHRESEETQHWSNVCQALRLREGSSILLWCLGDAESGELCLSLER